MDLFHYEDGAGAKSQVFILNNLVAAGIKDVLVMNFKQAFKYLANIVLP